MQRTFSQLTDRNVDSNTWCTSWHFTIKDATKYTISHHDSASRVTCLAEVLHLTMRDLGSGQLTCHLRKSQLQKDIYQGQTDQDGVWGRMAHSYRQRPSNPPSLRRNPWPSSNPPPGPCGLRRTSGLHLAFVEPSRFFSGFVLAFCIGLRRTPPPPPPRRTSRPSSKLRPAPRPSSNFVSARWYPESSSKFSGHPALRPS